MNKGFRGSILLISLLLLFSMISSYFSPGGLVETQYPDLFYNYFTQQVSGKLAITLFNFLCIGIGMILINMISIQQEIVEKQNYFPVFLYFFISYTCVNPNLITRQVVTNMFVLYAIYKLLNTYRKEEVLSEIFVASFWLGVSALITISSIINFPLFFICLLILRPFYWREFVMALLGFFVPFFIYECMAYLSDFNQWYLIDAIVLYFQYVRAPLISEYYIPLILVLSVLLVLAILSNFLYGFGNTVKKQKAKSILLWFLFLSAFGFFSGGSNSASILLTYAFPISFFIGDFLFTMKQLKIANTILAILLFSGLVIILGQYALI